MIAKCRIGVFLTVACIGACVAQDSGTGKWKVHDKNRPQPRIVEPAPVEHPAAPPSDAIVLFDGKDLSEWTHGDGKDARWKVKDGYMEVAQRSGGLMTRKKFGSCQLHIEWASPGKVRGKGQGRGNSGVYLMSTYEVQVLDSYRNKTYPDGQAASAYGQNPPLVNASRPPGEWQTYDIIFHRPKFKDRKLVRKATLTIFHNGVLVQDHFELWGASTHARVARYRPHADRLPLKLQDHRDPVRYRNVWIRELQEE